MTKDTDHEERETDEQAASLPLIDTFAALAAEIDAKSDRIERLESELDQGYLDPEGGTQESAGQTDSEGAGLDDVPRSHEDWEPETDPLQDTSAAAAGSAAPDRSPEPEEHGSEGSGLSPVKTASSDETGLEPDERNGAPNNEAFTEPGEGAAQSEEFGVTMDTASNLTGGSLGSSAGSTGSKSGMPERTAGGNASDSVDEALPDPTADRGERLSRLVRWTERHDEGQVVEAFVRGLDGLDDVTREMLVHYREAGDAAPVDAHVAAGGSGKRRYAYARNRTLRKAGVIEHDGAGRYRYALPDLVAEAFDGSVDDDTVADAVEAIESAADLH